VNSRRNSAWCSFVVFFLLSALTVSVFAQTKPVRLRNETIQTTIEAARGNVTAPEPSTATGLFLIQFTGSLRPEWRSELETMGMELLRYVPDDAFVVRMNGVPSGQVRQLSFIQWIGNYRAEHKLHRALQTNGPAAQRPSGPLPVTILLAPRTSSANLASTRGLMNSIFQESQLRFGTILRGNVDAGSLTALANSDAVLWIEPAPRIRLFDEESSKLVGGDDAERSTPTLTQQLGFNGSGVKVAVADSGLDTGSTNNMHPDLAGRVSAFFQYGTLPNARDEHSHGTHVAGIIAGNATVGETDENGAWYGLGVASGANIIAQRIFDGVGNFHAPPSFETLTRNAVSAGATVGNNSWGEDVGGRYDTTAAEFDELVRDADSISAGDQPYILEFSAGNAGPGAGTIGTPAVAKNVIASGASQNNRLEFFIYADGPDAMADFSSRGPCEDGRIKPDVVAPGTWIASLRSQFADDNNAWADISARYMYQGGTSQSGPHVSGAAAVLVQYYRSLTGSTPSPALVKAALINSALDLFDELGTDPVPNNDEGWGSVDLTEIIGTDRNVISIDQTNLLTTGMNYETTVTVNDATEPLKITLAYTDVPGFPGALPALVNDLDLEVTGPNGTLYRGNRFFNGNSIANPSTADSINNVEGVHLLAPTPGVYRVRIYARNVPEDARANTPAVDQDFALVMSGKFLQAGEALIHLDRAMYRAPDRVYVGVVDPDRAGIGSLSVTLTSGAEPGGQTLTLFPKTANGVFTNSILTATGPAVPADGQLQVAHGNTIEARYNDVSAGVFRTTTAQVDLVAPVISSVSVTNLFGRPVIRWNTDEAASSRVDYGTNSTLTSTTNDSALTLQHRIALENLIPGVTYFFRVISSDEAGNTATNNNGGALFSFVAPTAPPVLLVDAFFDDLFFTPPPLSRYTTPLNQLGIPFDIWDHETEGDLTLADLRPYRVVLWHMPEFNFTTYPSWSAGERLAISNYLSEGGSMFVAAMEILSRLDDVGGGATRTNVLQVTGFQVDASVSSVTGTTGDLIGGGMSFTLDYTDYEEFDVSDTIIPSGSAAGIFTDDTTGEFAGLRYPRTGVDSPGRLVFLSFPFEAVPASGPAPNNRTELLRRILQFLAPGLNGEAVVTLDRAAYTLPSQMIVEVGDADVAGTGQVTVNVSTTTEPAGQNLVLEETPRRGLFRGSITLVSATNAPLAGRLRAAEGNSITARFLDVSTGQNVEQTAVVDTIAPEISDVSSEPDYSTAVIFWDTDEPSDSLVQFGESLPLPVNRTEFSAALTTSHEVTLAGLQPNRTYYYRVVSRDSAGNATTDDNAGDFHTFHTKNPITPPFTDAFETGATNWQVFSSDESEAQWTLGVPNNGVETAAHSPANAWGSSLNGYPVSVADTFLISPAIYLTNGNQLTLRFWHSYDFTERSEFDLLEGGELLLVEDPGNTAVALATYIDGNFEWEEEQIDLTPYLGKVVYLVWHHQLLSFDFLPRPGWLVDDVQILTSTINVGTVIITNNLSQSTFTLTGPTSRSGAGTGLTVSNAPAGQYVATFGTVPYYTTPGSQTNTLSPGATLQFTAGYTFPDSNTNGISDLWEQAFLGSVPPVHPPGTDTDGDGASNYAEFIAGTNPIHAGSRLKLLVTRQPNNLLHLEWPTAPGRSYRLFSSTNVSTWTPLTDWTRAAGSSMSQLFTPTNSRTLLRVQVQP
jgi:subtilisin family serine protease